MINPNEDYIVSKEFIDELKTSVSFVTGIKGSIDPADFAKLLKNPKASYSTGSGEMTGLVYKLKGQTIKDIANEIRLAKSSNDDILVKNLPGECIWFPMSYGKVIDGDYLYKANFSYNRFQENLRNSINSCAEVEEDYTLKVDSTDVSGADQRYIGIFPMYKLENKTYTLEFDFFKEKSVPRSRIYFARGVFLDSETGGKMNGSRCLTSMLPLGFQIYGIKGGSDFWFVDGGWNWKSTNLIQPNSEVWQANGNEISTKLKIVLKGGAKKNATIYNGYGLIPTANVATWTGDIIPIYFTIYCGDNLAGEGLIYQPATNPLTVGIGTYEKPTGDQYYGVRNLTVYKGDTVNSKISFTLNGTSYTVSKGTPWEIFIDNNPNLNLSYKSYANGAQVYIGDELLTDTTNHNVSGKAVMKYDGIVANGEYRAAVKVYYVTLEHSGGEFEDDALIIAENSFRTFTATATPLYAYNTTFAWESSDESVVRISAIRGNQCVVVGVKAGTATITVKAYSDGVYMRSDSCEITVKEAQVQPTSITLNQSSISLEKGDTYMLYATVEPDSATDKSVIWASDSYIATVNENGLVTAASKGTATITATTANNLSATCTVEVTATESGGDEPSETITFDIRFRDVWMYPNGNLIYGDVNIAKYTVQRGMTWGEFIESNLSGHDELYCDMDTSIDDGEKYGRIIHDPYGASKTYPELKDGMTVYLYNPDSPYDPTVQNAGDYIQDPAELGEGYEYVTGFLLNRIVG